MTLELRVALFIASLLTLVFVSRRIRSSKVRLEDSIFWICLAILIFLLSVIPEVFYRLSELVGTYAPVNFVFLFFIFVLLIQSFNLSMRISQADTRIKELTQQLAVEKFERHMNDKVRHGDVCEVSEADAIDGESVSDDDSTEFVDGSR